MSNAAALRAERRRQRILENSNDRMKKIFGGENFHEEHLKLDSVDTSVEAFEEHAKTVYSANGNQNSENNVHAAQSFDPSVFEALLMGQQNAKNNQETAVESNVPPSYVRTSAFPWLILGILIRIVLTSQYASFLMDSAVVPFLLTFSSVEFLFPIEERPGQLFAVLGLINPKIMPIVWQIYCLMSRFMRCVALYMLSFTTTEVILSFI